MDKETIKMMDILTKNKERIQTQDVIEKQIKEDRKRINKAKRKQNIKALIIGALLVLLGIIMIYLLIQEDKTFVKNCTNAGLSENVCRKAS